MFNPAAEESLARERVRERTRDAENHVERHVTSALANLSLFALCSKRELKLVAKLAKAKKVPEGTQLVIEDDPGDTMFVLVSGTAEVHKSGRKIVRLGSGDVIGELAILGKSPRTATVTMTSDSDVASIGRRELFRLLEEAPGFAGKLFEALAARIRELDRKLVC